jgi:hypothetical protein
MDEQKERESHTQQLDATAYPCVNYVCNTLGPHSSGADVLSLLEVYTVRKVVLSASKDFTAFTFRVKQSKKSGYSWTMLDPESESDRIF